MLQAPIEGNILYQNFSLTNHGIYPILATITDQRDSVILEKPCDWEMSIVRFQINGDSIPLFRPVLIAPLTTNMSVTLFFSGTYFLQNVMVTPDEVKDGIFYYSPYIDHVNDALAAAFVALKAAFPGASATSPPYLALNPITQLINLYVQDDYLKSNPGAIGIGFNQYLFTIIDFPYSQFNGYSTLNGYDYVIDIDNHAVLLPAAPRIGYPFAINGFAGDVLQVSQEFPTLHLWDTVKSIIFTTSLIPVVKEILPNSFSSDQSNNVSNNSLSILTDFNIPKNANEPRPSIFDYVPSGEYRMISMSQCNPYKVGDVTANYQDYSGQIFPINLLSVTNFDMKAMYRKKFFNYK